MFFPYVLWLSSILVVEAWAPPSGGRPGDGQLNRDETTARGDGAA